jgi:hypothetical protein
MKFTNDDFGETEVYRMDYYQTLSKRSERKFLILAFFLNVACKIKLIPKLVNDIYCTCLSITLRFVEIDHDHVIFYLQKDGKSFRGRPSVLGTYTKTGRALLCHTMIVLVSQWSTERK